MSGVGSVDHSVTRCEMNMHLVDLLHVSMHDGTCILCNMEAQQSAAANLFFRDLYSFRSCLTELNYDV